MTGSLSSCLLLWPFSYLQQFENYNTDVKSTVKSIVKSVVGSTVEEGAYAAYSASRPKLLR